MNIEEFEKNLINVKIRGQEHTAACPVCEKGDPKGNHLYYRMEGGKPLIHCKHGCSYEEILQELNINRQESDKSAWQLLRNHYYHDERGLVIARKDIFMVDAHKKVVWLRKEGNTFVNGLNDMKMPLYNLPSIMSAPPEETICIVEGEKDVDTLTSIGYTATASPNGASWKREHSEYLKGRSVIVIPDYDEAGKKYREQVVQSLRGIANRISILDLWKHIPGLPVKADITDVYKMFGEDEIRDLLARAETEMLVETVADRPVWLTTEVGKDGTQKNGIDEAAFVNYFKERNSLVCVNGGFYDYQGPIHDFKIGSMIHSEIAEYFTKGLATKEKALLAALRSACYMEIGEPDLNEIQCSNVTLRLEKGSEILASAPRFSMNRLAVSYEQEVPEPLVWKQFLSELLYEEDIPCLQEFLGYCLLPTTIAQKCLNVVGNGGEGKSRIGVVCNAIFGSMIINDKIGKIAEDKFLLPQLEGKNLFYDDDLDTRKLTDTGLFKNLVTNEIYLQGERKGIDKFRVRPYVRFLACGNTQLASCFDKTDGFYRRMMIMKCRPKTRTEEQDDPYLTVKLLAEKEAIFLWMLEGLQRLLDHDFRFSISPRMQENLRQAKEDDTNIIAFMQDTEYLERSEDSAVSSRNLLDMYKYWCNRNADVPLADRTFLEFIKGNQEKLGIEYSDQLKLGSNGSRVRGYRGLEVTEAGRRALGTIAYRK